MSALVLESWGFSTIEIACINRGHSLVDVFTDAINEGAADRGIRPGAASDALDQSRMLIIDEAVHGAVKRTQGSRVADWRIEDGVMQIILDGAGWEVFS